MRAALLACVWVAVFAGTAEGTTYYVRTDGNNGNLGTSNTAGGAWQTITFATDSVTAGDTIRVQGDEDGENYAETATPSDSGTSGNPVTLVADGRVTTCGLSFTGQNYIRVIGFRMDGSLSGCTLVASRVLMTGTNVGLEFWNNIFLNGQHIWKVNAATDRCTSCIIIGGSISKNADTFGAASNAITITGDDSYVGYVALSEINYLGIVSAGVRGRFLNNTFAGFLQIGGSHPDFYFPANNNTLGWSRNLIEGNYGIGTVTSIDNKVMHMSNGSTADWADNVWRGSVFYNMGSGFFSVYDGASGGAVERTHFYNHTIVNCNRAVASNPRCGNFSDQFGPPVSATIRNHIFSQAWSDNITTGIDVWFDSFTAVTDADYNLADDPDGSVTFAASWLAQANELSNVDPGFVAFGTDFTLQSGSLARGAGGHLTNAVGAGVSSTELTVTSGTGGMVFGDNSANLPQYGGKLVPGDFIMVGSTQAQVASVSGDVITLAAPISWSDGASIYWGTSTTIDLGAYPYKAGGYELNATYAGSSTKTITPNDASLVRMVVCFSDSVPYEIDNATPFTCTAPAGEFSATVYPRYAGLTLGVEAEEVVAAIGPIRRPRRKGN